jgi:AraC-like DNA-binding protein
MDGSRKLPSVHFTTADLRGRDQFEVWNARTAAIYDSIPHSTKAVKTGFKASGFAYHLNGVLLSGADYSAQQLVRGRKQIAQSNIDVFEVHLCASGGLISVNGSHETVASTGDINIFDLSRPITRRSGAAGSLSIMVPRKALYALTPMASDLHGHILRGNSAVGGLLSDYMKMLLKRVDQFTLDDAPTIADATMRIVAACFGAGRDLREYARAPINMVVFEQIRHFIIENLYSPSLGPDMLCVAFRLTRTQLYRLFESQREGGVMSYIQKQRLAHVFSNLRDPTQRHRRIFEIAADFGFINEAHFSRLFRQTYGASPSEVRIGSGDPFRILKRGGMQGSNASYIKGWLENLR